MATSTASTTGTTSASTNRARSLFRQVELAWARNRVALIGLVVTLLALGLRLLQISANGYRLDEIWSIWITRQSVPDMVGSFFFDNLDLSPPTYYILLQPFLQFGHDALALRALSVIAGALVVWVTFRFALDLFNIRIATVSALIVAVAPLHIEYSQVSRAYMLASLFALLSLYFFSRLVLGTGTRWSWIGLVAASVAMLYTHYLTALVLLFENLFIVGLWLRRTSTGPGMRKWAISQVAVVIAALPLVFTSLYGLSHVKPGRGFAWLPRPDTQAIIKSAILFATGDPSYGPTGVTIARVISLATIGAIGLLGLWFFLRHVRRQPGNEGRKLLLLLGAIVVPLGTALVVSQVRSIYHEKYYLFVLPPIAMLIAWVLVRAIRSWVGFSIALSFVCMLGLSLFVYFSAPAGEQWREAVGYLRAAYKPGDVVLVAPGYYGRPLAYYLSGGFPAEMRTLGFAPLVAVEGDKYSAIYFDDGKESNPATCIPAREASRIWLVTGYAAPTEEVQSWLGKYFTKGQSADFLGAHVRMMERAAGSGECLGTRTGATNGK